MGKISIIGKLAFGENPASWGVAINLPARRWCWHFVHSPISSMSGVFTHIWFSLVVNVWVHIPYSWIIWDCLKLFFIWTFKFSNFPKKTFTNVFSHFSRSLCAAEVMWPSCTPRWPFWKPSEIRPVGHVDASPVKFIRVQLPKEMYGNTPLVGGWTNPSKKKYARQIGFIFPK